MLVPVCGSIVRQWSLAVAQQIISTLHGFYSDKLALTHTLSPNLCVACYNPLSCFNPVCACVYLYVYHYVQACMYQCVCVISMSATTVVYAELSHSALTFLTLLLQVVTLRPVNKQERRLCDKVFTPLLSSKHSPSFPVS